ncbi:MAG: V-type ATP synthase subunit E family protein [Candidatus Aminicenantes bacterium]|jgi:vacuolar-type H+-ATPase subunit E/Vma4
MSLEKILDKIVDDANAEADKIRLESLKKAEKIKEDAEKEASELADAMVEEAKRQGQLEASRLITQARLETKINILSRKKELVQEVMEKAFQKKILGKKSLKRTIITKEGEREEAVDEARLKEELRSRLENEVIEILGI